MDQQRQSIREKQDHLLKLAEARGMNLDLRVSVDHPGSPTLRELHHFIFPEWVGAISTAIRFIERELGGIGDA